MALEGYTVAPATYRECADFCTSNHYSKTCPPGVEYFKVLNPRGITQGVAVYGRPAMRGQSHKYGTDVELRRLCCLDDTPRNIESFMIGRSLRALAKAGYKKVLSLADPEHGHTGVIYKASNFEYVGVQSGGVSRTVIIGGERYHSKTAYGKFGTSCRIKLKAMFPEKDVQVINHPRKHVYVYTLRSRPKR